VEVRLQGQPFRTDCHHRFVLPDITEMD
jgi:hypothetical protein